MAGDKLFEPTKTKEGSVENKDVTSDAPAQQLKITQRYIHKQEVEIRRVDDIVTRSGYYKVNQKYYAGINKRQLIGSSIFSTNALMTTSQEEIKKYMPGIIGVPSSSERFEKAARDWLNNISREVPANEGLILDISFNYNSEEVYALYKKEEDKIEKQFEYDLANGEHITKADKKRNLAKHNLEATKYEHGTPVNVLHYMLWRHILLYSHVAKDRRIINMNSTVRFYINDKDKENKIKAAILETKQKAGARYYSIHDDVNKLSNVAYNLSVGLDRSKLFTDDLLSLRAYVFTALETNPSRFLEVVNNSDLDIIASIEKLIEKGELERLPSNQNIRTKDGDILASNTKDMIEWWKTDLNKPTVSKWEQLLK